MSTQDIKPAYQDLVPALVDTTTVYFKKNNKGHPWYTYIWCTILRITIGLILLHLQSNQINNNYLAVYAFAVAFAFFSKFLTVSPTWKVYMRTVLCYTIIVASRNHPNFKDIAGSIMIIDAIMGLQSRFIQGNISRTFVEKVII
jgi:hypothetical protein